MSFAKGIFLQLVDTELLTQTVCFFWSGWLFLQYCFYYSIIMVKFSGGYHYALLSSSS